MKTPIPTLNALDVAALAIPRCQRCLRPGPIYTKLEFKAGEPVYHRLCRECANKYEGVGLQIEVESKTLCGACRGSGVDPSDNNAEHDRECPKCDGTGTVRPCELCDGQKRLDAGGGITVWCYRCCGTGEWMTEQEAQERTEALKGR